MINPQLLIAFDKSASMNMRFGAGPGTRLAVAQQAIRDLVLKHQKIIHFGYMDFPNIGPGCMRADGCCPGLVFPPAPDNYRVIDDAMRCGGGFCPMQPAVKPTAQALAACGQYYDLYFAKERHVLLLTDGDPTCAVDSTMSPACEASVGEIAKMNRDGVKTVVVGVGESGASATASPCLHMMAQLGGGPLRPATDPRALSEALAAILEDLTLRSCHIEIRETAKEPGQISVRFDGMTVRNDPVDGWSFDPPTSTDRITITGSWCDKLRTSQVREIEISACTSNR
jgi:hypothetical protein